MNILELAGLEAGHRQAHQLPAKAYAIGQGGAQLAVNQWLIRLAGSVGLRFCTRSRKAGAAFFLSSSAACLLVLRTRPIRVSMIQKSLRGRPAMIVLLAFTTRQLWRRTGSGVAGLNAAPVRLEARPASAVRPTDAPYSRLPAGQPSHHLTNQASDGHANQPLRSQGKTFSAA